MKRPLSQILDAKYDKQCDPFSKDCEACRDATSSDKLKPSDVSRADLGDPEISSTKKITGGTNYCG